MGSHILLLLLLMMMLFVSVVVGNGELLSRRYRLKPPHTHSALSAALTKEASLSVYHVVSSMMKEVMSCETPLFVDEGSYR